MDNKHNDIIKTTLDSIKGIVESNTVIGEPVNTPGGITIIPVSKVSLGFASGGLDYASKKEETAKNNNFGGGSGTGVSVVPMAFLVVKPDGTVELLNMSVPDTTTNQIATVGNLIEKTPDVIEKIKNIFVKEKKEEKGE
ncbi:MAG: GerW family sporulation protein [Clostridia bacterium]|jgi:sporulation protein YtfJ|nr:GerW family sporulation protein [Clostridia bacterium]